MIKTLKTEQFHNNLALLVTEQKIAKNCKKLRYICSKWHCEQINKRKGLYQEGILISMYLLQCVYIWSQAQIFYSRVYLGQLARWPVFYQAQLTVHFAAFVWFDFANDGPFNGRNVTLILGPPNKL